jgi:hypothetical protein
MAPMQSKSWWSPGQLVAVMLAGWINRHQQAVIAYQKEEIKVRCWCWLTQPTRDASRTCQGRKF